MRPNPPVVHPSDPGSRSRPQRRTIPRAAAVLGALISALCVVYAGSLALALLAASAFFAFYWQLGLPRHTQVDGSDGLAERDRTERPRVA